MEKAFAENLENLFKNEENLVEKFLTELFKEEIRYKSVSLNDDEKNEVFEAVKITALSKNNLDEFISFSVKIYRPNPNLSKGNVAYIIRKINEYQILNDLMRRYKEKEVYLFLTIGMTDNDKMEFISLTTTMTGDSGTIYNSEGKIQESKLTKNYLIDIQDTDDMKLSKIVDALVQEKKLVEAND